MNTNQLTSFTGTGLGSLTALDLRVNLIDTFIATGMNSLFALYLDNNKLTALPPTLLALARGGNRIGAPTRLAARSRRPGLHQRPFHRRSGRSIRPRLVRNP